MTVSDKSEAAFRSISEASGELDVPAHVLRFWEGKFSQIRPMKRAGGRRFYRPEDMALLRGIRAFLHEDGYTIKGVQRLLKEQGVAFVRRRGDGAPAAPAAPAPPAAAPLAAPPPADLGPLFAGRADDAAPSVGGSALRRALSRLEQAYLTLDRALAR